jgi:hypothetical protein
LQREDSSLVAYADRIHAALGISEGAHFAELTAADIMKATTVSIIKATAPLVSQHARSITGLFYKNMFANNPETLQFFNQANQVYSTASQYIDPQFHNGIH